MTQTIYRAKRRDQWVMIDQRAVEDVRLSWAARGLLAYLLSRPDDWKVLVNDLKKRGNLKRDGIYKLLRELRSTGYMTYQHTRDAKGRMRGGIYTVSEIPSTALPDTGRPNREPPYTAKALGLPNTEVKLITTTTTKPTTTQETVQESEQGESVPLPDSLPESTRREVRRLLGDLDHADAQLVMNEWLGAWAAGEIRVSAIGYLGAIVKRHGEGSMSIRHGAGLEEP